MIEVGATFQQKYEEVLKEFVEYCNKQTPTQRMTGLHRLMDDFIQMKMERYR